jgi:hypothetical protein
MSFLSRPGPLRVKSISASPRGPSARSSKNRAGKHKAAATPTRTKNAFYPDSSKVHLGQVYNVSVYQAIFIIS